MSSTPPPGPTQQSGGDPVARPTNAIARIGLIIAIVALLGALGFAYLKPPPNPQATGSQKEPVEFAAPTEEERMRQELEKLLGDAISGSYELPVIDLTEENISQVEQLAPRYPGAELELDSSSYEESDAVGQLYRLIYNTDDSVAQIKDWYEKEYAPDYRTTTPNAPGGLKGYTIKVRVPGIHVARDFLIVEIPDQLTGESATQIWVTIQNTFRQTTPSE